jgi:hypothetical protein
MHDMAVYDGLKILSRRRGLAVEEVYETLETVRQNVENRRRSVLSLA